MFGEYLSSGDPKPYRLIEDTENLVKTFEGFLEDFNAENPKRMDLVLFMDAIEHISRTSRIIRQPKGNALLLGVGGSGRQSLTRLAAFAAEFKCCQIEITKVQTLSIFYLKFHTTTHIRTLNTLSLNFRVY